MKTKLLPCLTAMLVCVAKPGLLAADISLESAPPVVVKTVPAAGATDVDPGLAEIKVTYSKAMQDGSWSWSTWGEENYPETTGKPKYLADARTCVLPVKLKPNQFYAIWLNSEKFKNFQDKAGQPAVPYLLTFFTGEPGRKRSSASTPSTAFGVGAVIAEKIRAQVAHQLQESGATLEDLIVTVAVARDSATPFKVSYRGLRNFKSSAGKVVSPPDGEFIMDYNGGGRWQGALAGVRFTAQVGIADMIDLPFVNDPQVLGEWESVDFVPSPASFDPDKRAWGGDLYLKGFNFLANGKFPQSWWTWTKGAVIHHGDKTVSHYEIKEIKGQTYMFYEWKSGDVTVLGVAPSYYVLKKKTSSAATQSLGLASEAIVARNVNRLVSEFPAAEDLSTPESACAAWQRASARKDGEALSRLSLVPIDAKEQENWYRREEQRDAAGLATYLKALADSKIVVVQLWRGELANVITFLPFPEGKGRSPYSARTFGRVNGEWKNLGEDRLPDLASAKAGFEKKKERLWQQFSELNAKAASSASPDKQSAATDPSLALLNDDQRAVLAWTDRQFRGFFDSRKFEGWSVQEKADLEAKSIDALSGPRSQDYYCAINTLGALRSTKALTALRGIAYERVDRNNRDRWMAIRSLGLIGDKADVPELIHLVYHGNVNTRWWAQISLVRITGKNFGKDWNAWGECWNDQKGKSLYKPEIVRWWDGQPEPDKLAQSLEESDQKFLADLNGKSASTPKNSSDELAARIKAAEPTMKGIRENWTATVTALDNGDNAAALVAARQLPPHIQDFLEKFRGTALEPGTAKALDLIKSLATALEKDDQATVQTSRSAMATLGRSMEEQIKATVTPGND